MQIRFIFFAFFLVIVASKTAFSEVILADTAIRGADSGDPFEIQGDDSRESAHLLNIYGSVEYFFNTNPSAISVRTIQIRGVSPSSHGYDFYASVSSRELEITNQVGFGFGYAYSSTFFVRQEAKFLDSADHDINAKLSYYPLENLEFNLEGDVRFNYFNQVRISTDYGGTLTTAWTSDGGQSLNVHAGILKERFSDKFNDRAGGSLRYQDAWNRSIGFGGDLFEPESGISLSFDYTFTDHRTYIRAPFRRLSRKARDGRFREHAAYADLTVPLKGALSRFSFDGDLYYSYRDHLNRQSGLLYPSARRQFMKVIALTLGGKINAVLWEPAGLTLTLGISDTRSRSLSVESTYVETKYYARISAYY